MDTRLGVVSRIVNDWVAYLYDSQANTTYSFTPAVVAEFNGEGFEELNIVQGRVVQFLKTQDGVVTHVFRPTRDLVSEERRDDEDILGERAPRPQGTRQYELHPDEKERGTIRCPRAMPRLTRGFGKLFNTDPLRAGDLLLTREKDPSQELICEEIQKAQLQGGYDDADARWTHAALYLGDGANLVEATTTSGPIGNVRITSLDDFCQGTEILRFRRPKHLTSEQLAWRFCVRALSRLGQPYDWVAAARTWFKVVINRRGFYESNLRFPTQSATICSTFYSDAFNEATGRRLSEVNGSCVPAWLSVSDEFEDVQTHWLRITQ